jgi:hypothetical protein
VIIQLWKSLLVLAVIFSVEGVHPNAVWASDKESEGATLINHAIHLTDLTQSGPYHIGASLTVVDEAVGKREGTDVITFSSTERWRRELHMTGYDEVAVFLGHNMYRTRSLGFTPPSLRTDIAGSLRNLPETLNYKVLRVFNHKVNDVEARCVYLEQKNGQPVEVTWCFDPHTGLPVAQLSGNGHRRIEFSNYKPFGNKFVPGSVEVIVDRKQTGRAVIETIDSGITDSAHVFEPPVGATARQWCDNMESPRLISVARPNIPPAARFGTGLELNYELTVDVQGNVTSVIPMAASPYADRIAIETMRDWQLKPAMCDHTPVPTDMSINLGALRH